MRLTKIIRMMMMIMNDDDDDDDGSGGGGGDNIHSLYYIYIYLSTYLCMYDILYLHTHIIHAMIPGNLTERNAHLEF